MKVLSLFSGVGGFDLGLERAGMETVFQCEWDKHATKILEKHWPHVPRWGDVTTLTGQHILAHAPVIDVVAWGSPCQDLSVAGKRAGLQGARSGLFHEGVRIIKELRELTNGKYPRISIWENVAGALSSGAGADFGQVLYEMDEAGACFSEWRILDAQYFGVPQRRRRVFLVSIFDTATAARCPDPLLPVRESVRRDTQAGSATREEPASETSASPRGGGADVAGSLTWRMKNGYNGQDAHSNLLQVVNHARPVGTAVLGSEIVANLAASDFKWPQNQQVEENKFIVEAFTKGKRPQTADDDETWDENRPAPTLNSFDQGDTRATTLIAFENSYRDAARIATEGITNTLSAKMGTGGNNTPMVAIPIQDGREMEKNQNGLGVAKEGSPAYTLDQTGAQAVAIGIQGNVIGRQPHNGPGGKGHTDEGDPMFTLTSTDVHAVATLVTMREGKPGGGKGPLISEDKSLSLSTGNEQTLFQPAQAAGFKPGASADARTIGYEEELSPSLEAGGGGNNKPAVVIQYDGYNQKIHVDEPSVTLRIGRDSSDFVAQPAPTTMAVRRLTPLECERLMGWPDDWTAGQSDTHRYKQCGNGVASPVAQWIAQQLLQLDNQ